MFYELYRSVPKCPEVSKVDFWNWWKPYRNKLYVVTRSFPKYTEWIDSIHQEIRTTRRVYIESEGYILVVVECGGLAILPKGLERILWIWIWFCKELLLAAQNFHSLRKNWKRYVMEYRRELGKIGFDKDLWTRRDIGSGIELLDFEMELAIDMEYKSDWEVKL